MSKSSPSAPAPVDAGATASAQSAANKETAITQAALNRMNQTTPYGSLKYSNTSSAPITRTTSASGIPVWLVNNQVYTDMPSAQDAAKNAGTWEVNQTLSPEQQKLYENSTQIQSGLGKLGLNSLEGLQGLFSSNFTPQNLPDNVTNVSNPDFATQRQQVEDINYQGQTRKLDPYYAQQEAAMGQSLADRGIPEGSDNYNKMMSEFQRSKTDAYQQARNASTLAGSQEQQALRSQSLQEALANANLTNSQRQQMLQEQLSLRAQPINEISGLLSGSGVTMPSFTNAPQVNVGGTDVLGANNSAYQGAMNNYNTQLQQQNAKAAGIGSLLGTGAQVAMMYSDRRLKHNITKIGKLKNGINLYRYSYIWENISRIGVMADEVKNIFPKAVGTFNGYDAVDYNEALKGA